MGIQKIEFLHGHNVHIPSQAETHRMALQAQAALQEKLMKEHCQGQHPYGSMRRECPMCQAAK